MKRCLITKLISAELDSGKLKLKVFFFFFPAIIIFLHVFSFFFPLHEILHQCLGRIKKTTKIKLSTVPLYFCSLRTNEQEKTIFRLLLPRILLKNQNFEVGNHRKYAVLAATRRGPLNLNI